MTSDERIELALSEIEHLKVRIEALEDKIEKQANAPVPIITPFDERVTTPVAAVPRVISDINAGPVFLDDLTQETRST